MYILHGLRKPYKSLKHFAQKTLVLLLLLSLLTTNFLSLFVSPVYAASSPWTQTDWSGGSGQTAFSDATKFDSSSNVTTSTAGQATLTANSEELSNTGFESNLTSWQTGAAPDSISGLLVWLDSESSPLYQNSNGTTAAAADGDPVGYWGDLSGNGNNLIQATAGRRPLLKTGIQNGLPSVLGDGTDDYLRASFTFTLPSQFVYVTKLISDTVDRYAGGVTAFSTVFDRTNATTLRVFNSDGVATTTAGQG